MGSFKNLNHYDAPLSSMRSGVHTIAVAADKLHTKLKLVCVHDLYKEREVGWSNKSNTNDENEVTNHKPIRIPAVGPTPLPQPIRIKLNAVALPPFP